MRDAELNILAANDLCVALYGDVVAADRLPINLALIRLRPGDSVVTAPNEWHWHGE